MSSAVNFARFHEAEERRKRTTRKSEPPTPHWLELLLDNPFEPLSTMGCSLDMDPDHGRRVAPTKVKE